MKNLSLLTTAVVFVRIANYDELEVPGTQRTLHQALTAPDDISWNVAYRWECLPHSSPPS